MHGQAAKRVLPLSLSLAISPFCIRKQEETVPAMRSIIKSKSDSTSRENHFTSGLLPSFQTTTEIDLSSEELLQSPYNDSMSKSATL